MAQSISNQSSIQEKKIEHPQYSFTAFANSERQVAIKSTPSSAKASYVLTEDEPQNVPPADPPPIGPEIGPDPRNCKAHIKMSQIPTQRDDKNFFAYDFTHGLRALLSKKAPEPCILMAFDADSGCLLYEFDLKPGEFAMVERKYYIRYHLELWDIGKTRKIAEYEYDCEGKTVAIVIPDGGLGDNLAWLPYAEEFRVQKKVGRLVCYCGEWLIRLVRDQYPEIEFCPITVTDNMGDCYATYYCAIFPKERKTWRPVDHQNTGMQGSVARILNLEPVPRKVRLKLDAERVIAEPYVCISAMATNPAKYWNYPDGWNMIIRWLKGCGYRVFVIDRDRELYFRGIRFSAPVEAEDCTGFRPLTERIAMLQHADFFIGLPSGLSWLAWNCNIPVVMLSGFTLDGTEFPTPYRVTNFNFCHGCWNDSGLFFDMTDPIWCPRHKNTDREIECTRAITPRMVQNTIRRIPGVRPWQGTDPEPNF